MGVSGGPKSNVDGLIFHLDPANKRSYPGTGTTIYDLSGNNYTSYFANGALLADDLVRVDGVDDYIATPIFNLTAPITVTAWVKNVVNEGIVFGSYNGGVYANAEYIFEYFGKTIIIQGNPGGAKTFQLPQLNFNQWSYLAMTRDSSNNMSVFLNGVASSSNPQSYSNNLNFNQIGRYSNFSNQYNAKGSIGEVKIYNRALSSIEILQNYNVSKTRYNVVENIITNGLVLNFDASNPSSYVGTGVTINNIVGIGNTGILTNGPTFSQLNGGSIVFDGTNDYINVADSPSLGMSSTNAVTVYAWFHATADGINSTREIIHKRNNDPTYVSYGISWGSSSNKNILFSRVGFDDGTYSDLNSDGLPKLKWINACTTFDGSVHNMYVDGNLVKTASVSSKRIKDDNLPVTLGSFNGTQEYFQGYISDAKIYNRALSSTEVLQNFNATKNRYIKVLPPISDALVLNLDAGSRASYVGTGTSWYDLSNSGFNSTLVGSPTFAGTGSSGYFVFDSNTKSATFNTSLLSGYSAGTIECSVYITNLSSSFILARQRNGVNTFSVLSVGNYTDAGGQLATGTAGIVYYHNKNAQTVLSSSTALQVNTWYRLAITFTTSSVILYINGVQDATVSGDYSVPSDTSTDPRVGAWIKDGTNYPMNGRLAQVQFYNRALTASEILQNFNFYRTRYGI
jgi:hypothetical protein